MASSPVRPTFSLGLALTSPLNVSSPVAGRQAPLQLHSPPPARGAWPGIQLSPAPPGTSSSLGPPDLSPLARVTHGSPLHPTSLVHTSHSPAPLSRHSNARLLVLPASSQPRPTRGAPYRAGARSSPGDHGPDEVQQQQAEGAQVLRGHGVSVPASPPAPVPHTPRCLRRRRVGSPAHRALKDRLSPGSPAGAGATQADPPPPARPLPGSPESG